MKNEDAPDISVVKEQRFHVIPAKPCSVTWAKAGVQESNKLEPAALHSGLRRNDGGRSEHEVSGVKLVEF